MDQAQAEAVMDTIIQKNVFLTPSGELIEKRDIMIVGTATNDLYDPPQA
ncbi:hypothetical protein DOT_1440 [Desulfosporosinus sp. OT]|nr:hypothetical protein DOT_1440 [Desulfosporosinus sp. OT]